MVRSSPSGQYGVVHPGRTGHRSWLGLGPPPGSENVEKSESPESPEREVADWTRRPALHRPMPLNLLSRSPVARRKCRFRSSWLALVEQFSLRTHPQVEVRGRVAVPLLLFLPQKRRNTWQPQGDVSELNIKKQETPLSSSVSLWDSFLRRHGLEQLPTGHSVTIWGSLGLTFSQSDLMK
jgi:hypothetical protein